MRRPGPVLRLPFLLHILLWLVLGLGVAAVTVWALWLLAGQPGLARAGGAASTQEKFDGVKIALTVVGGVGAVVALTVAYRKQRIGEAAERREDTRVFTDRFSKASELLGSGEAAVRLAGVYAMAALADDWESHQQACIDVLCAYLRMPYEPIVNDTGGVPGKRTLGLRKPSGRPATDSRDLRGEQQVRQSVIRVIAGHLREDAQIRWDGRTFDFTGAVFDGADFKEIQVRAGTTFLFNEAQFHGLGVNFYGAAFTGGEVSADLAVFRGIVNFNRATFAGTTIDLHGAEFGDSCVLLFNRAGFSGGEMNLYDGDFSGGHLEFHDAKFSGGEISFYRSAFRGTTISFKGTEFCGGELDIMQATVSGGLVSFKEAKVSAGEISFYRTGFAGGLVSFRDAEFSGGEVNFLLAEFAGGEVDFSGATFSGGEVDFTDAEFPAGAPDFSQSVFAGGKILGALPHAE